MTNPEPNSRLNVPIKLVAQPKGDFALAGSDGSVPSAAEGAAIVSIGGASGAGAVSAVSQLLNIEAPGGELASSASTAVKATDDLSFATTDLAHAHSGLSVESQSLANPDAVKAAGLNLGAPKFTY